MPLVEIFSCIFVLLLIIRETDDHSERRERSFVLWGFCFIYRRSRDNSVVEEPSDSYDS